MTKIQSRDDKNKAEVTKLAIEPGHPQTSQGRINQVLAHRRGSQGAMGSWVPGETIACNICGLAHKDGGWHRLDLMGYITDFKD